MTWWKKLEPTYKALTAILGAIAVGMGLMTFTLGGRTGANAEAIETIAVRNTTDHRTINARIHTLEYGVDTIQGDLALIRCWVLHDIQGTNAEECLVTDRGGRR